MNRALLRPILAPLFGLALCFAMSPRPGATVKDNSLPRFSARAVSVSDGSDAGPIDIMIERWSTDAERQKVVDAFVKGGPDTLLSAVRDIRHRAGVALMPGLGGGLGARVRTRTPRNLLFAEDVITPAGRRIIAAADQHVGFGERPRDARLDKADEFTLIEIRFGADGEGVGKVAPASKIAYNKAIKTIEIGDFAKRPVRLTAVQPEVQLRHILDVSKAMKHMEK